MSLIPVHFEYRTELRHIDLRDALLTGSWDGDGRPAGRWSTMPMRQFAADDGCPALQTTAMLDDGQMRDRRHACADECIRAFPPR
jgi:1,4-alpha-glucan branching enzyme